MCTAISFKTKDHYFGRNLDLHRHFEEAVVITPRYFDWHIPNINHYKAAIIGIATVSDNYPLYYDAVNENGLCIAGLNFPGNAVYHSVNKNCYNIASFELIPWVLTNCRNVDEAQKLLKRTNILNTCFSSALPPTPLHWIVCDKSASIVVEPVSSGLKIYNNPIGILTNNPPFPYHMQNLTNYLSLTSYEPTSRFSPHIQLKPYSLGMGGIGLPGDFSSASRFVRAAFVKENSICDNSESFGVSQFFHILESVSQPCGCVRLTEGTERTVYSSCCNANRGIYYYKTYDNSQITAVNLNCSNLNGKKLDIYPIRWEPNIFYENEATPIH